MLAENRSSRAVSMRPTLLLAALIVLALALRIWRLGDWSLEGDEIFTLRDSLHPRLTNARPLLYLLNYYLVRPLVPLDELGLRILPALFGVLAIPAFYFVSRHLVGTRAALFGTLLLAVNAMHVYHSQYARYWSLVFLLCAVYPFALYLGFRERNRGWLILGLVTCVLAVLAHPTAILLLGGLGLFLVTQLSRDRLARLWTQRSVRWGAALVVILAALAGARYLLVLRSWIFDRPRLQGGADHLLHSPGGPWVKQVAILLSYVDGLTPALALIGLLGIYLLWQSRDRSLALLLVHLLFFPMAFILLLAFRTAVSTTYLLSTTPIFFIGAGVLLDRLAGIEWELRPRWLLSAVVTTIVILAGTPTLISLYLDGRRNDFRGAAQWLDERLAPGDVVFSDQFKTLSHYLRGASPQRLLADPAPLMKSTRMLHESGAGGTLWIVKPATLQGGHRTNPQLGSLKTWIYDNCQLRRSIGVARLDFRHNELQIYRCRVPASRQVTGPGISPVPGTSRPAQPVPQTTN
jgi:hypothetical protein